MKIYPRFKKVDLRLSTYIKTDKPVRHDPFVWRFISVFGADFFAIARSKTFKL